MTTNTTRTDARSVETAWAETIQAKLPLEEEDEAKKYANFLFGNPLFTMGDVGPDVAVVLIDDLLDEHPPMEFFGVEGSLSTDEWATLKGTLVDYLAEGVDGERPGPASAFPGAPAVENETVASEAMEPPSPEAPETPGTDPTVAPTGRGFAAESPDLESVSTPTELARAVSDLVEAAQLESNKARRALELVIEDLEGESDDDDE